VKDQNQRVLANMRTRVFGRSKWNLLLGIIATIILIGSFSALAYNTLSEKKSDMFTLNGKEYDWNELGEMDTIEVQGFEGIPLVVLIEDAGVDEPSFHDYRIVGADGYFKTVTWRDVETGILTVDEKKVVFETKAKAYWVRDVVEIEVI